MFGCNREEITGNWRKFHNKELHGLYYSIAIISVKKLRRMRWAFHVNWWVLDCYDDIALFCSHISRSVSVCILQTFPSPLCIVSGVSQSSIQAPILLHIFISDLCFKVSHCFLIICLWSVNMLSNKSVVCGTKVVLKNWPPHYFENECYFLYS
jgi:hypothetical protein